MASKATVSVAPGKLTVPDDPAVDARTSVVPVVAADAANPIFFVLSVGSAQTLLPHVRVLFVKVVVELGVTVMPLDCHVALPVESLVRMYPFEGVLPVYLRGPETVVFPESVAPDIVLLVKVSVVLRPTSVSVDEGSVKMPVFVLIRPVVIVR